MWLALASTAFFMGLMGGTHCLVMCAAPCSAVTGMGARWYAGTGRARVLMFHAGRLLGYGMAGGLAAFAMEQLAWLGRSSAALRPAWTLMHVLIVAWGLLMLLQARQPAWIERAGRAVWARVRPWVNRPGGVFATGVAWALLPCGLLYTALLTAALSGGVLKGVLVMAWFGLGSAVWLLLGPWLLAGLRARLDGRRATWGARGAGLVLCVLGGWALWMDVMHGQPAPWC